MLLANPKQKNINAVLQYLFIYRKSYHRRNTQLVSYRMFYEFRATLTHANLQRND